MKVNWVGIIASLTIVLLLIMRPEPWWQLTAGGGEGYAAIVNISPLNVDIRVLDLAITPPLTGYLCLAVFLTLTAASITMMAGSLLGGRRFSENLINFAYLKPVEIVIFFVLVLYATLNWYIKPQYGFGIPLIGGGSIAASYRYEAVLFQLLIPFHTSFSWMFYIAVVSAVLCLLAKIYHMRLLPE